MSYDPRKGSSPYLGMDFDDEPAKASSMPEDVQAKRPDERRTTAAPSRPNASREVPPTVLRSSQAPQRGVAPRPQAVPAPAQAPRGQQRGVYAIPSPQQQAYVPEPSPVPSALGRRFEAPLTTLKAMLLVVLAWLLRLGAWLLALFVVVSAALTGSMRAQLISMLDIAAILVPPSLLGLFVRDTPFGGILRGDMVIASVILFIADWFCIRLSTSLRERRERRV